jgi:hypothetical protein
MPADEIAHLKDQGARSQQHRFGHLRRDRLQTIFDDRREHGIGRL